MTTTHLSPALWERASRHLIAKALAEFSHERLLTPAEEPDGRWSVTSDDGTATYRFTARRLLLDHWQVDAESIVREPGQPLDGVRFVLEFRQALGLGAEVLPVYLEEITSTLAGTCYKLDRPAVSAADLAAADFQTIESGMTEGHPCFVANNGRLGLDVDDYHRYAPETGASVHLVWLAAHRDHSTFTSCADLDYPTLIRGELPPEDLRRFEDVLAGLGLEPDDYHLLPVHPWQWHNRLAVTFAGEVAQRHLVHLGTSRDAYRPQQSIRTFFNTSNPERDYVKTALSVLNMGFYRGLSADYMRATPAINDWLATLVADDPVLRGCGLTVLRERAAIGYHPLPYEEATAKGSPYRKMLAALWRESPVPQLEDGERLATMASLLHTDRDGGSLAAALITRSGLDPAVWLRRYLDAYLVPLLHSFYAHDLVFMPHGENVILVLDEAGTVQRAIFKDLAEEIAVMSTDRPLPPDVERIRADVPEDMKLLSLFTDVFDCFFRFLAATLDESGVLEENAFWSTVAECARDYQKAQPQLAERFARHDLFTERFALSCLNRLQLRNNKQMVDLQDPAGALQLVGELENPLAHHRM